MEALQALVQRSTSIAEASPPSSIDQTGFIATKYGITIELDRSFSVRSITLSSPKTAPSPSIPPLPSSEVPNTDPPTGTPEPKPPSSLYRYRLFPDWNTSYLWYDSTWPQNPEDAYHVDIEEIEKRFPALYPYYVAWQEVYEVTFKEQGCHLGGTDPVFKHKEDSDIWLLEGFLMACWIALKEDVDQIEYKPVEVAYVLRKGKMEQLFEKFLVNLPDEY
jgi:hypothetical protein